MIKFDLKCDNDHIFEASFDDSTHLKNREKKADRLPILWFK